MSICQAKTWWHHWEFAQHSSNHWPWLWRLWNQPVFCNSIFGLASHWKESEAHRLSPSSRPTRQTPECWYSINM